MEIITLTDEAFYQLINKVIAEVKAKHVTKQAKWIDTKEAMDMLKITSKTTLQKLRDEGKIRFSQPVPKIIL